VLYNSYASQREVVNILQPNEKANGLVLYLKRMKSNDFQIPIMLILIKIMRSLITVHNIILPSGSTVV
jgi:hypothetical protein